MSEESATSQGIKSLETALSVLAVMSAHGGAMTLSEIARASTMPPSKVHRYLASFVHAGLVRQEGRSGRYDLGPAALQLGLAALARHDFVNHAADDLSGLSAETGMTVLLSVWGSEGATVVRWYRGSSPTITSMGLGTALPLLHSATGRVFLAWAPPAAIAAARGHELARAARNPKLLPDATPDEAGLEMLAASIRARGFASVDGRFIPGLVAAAAPILDWQNEAQAAITLVGTDPDTIAPGSPVIEALLSFCAARSVVRG